MRMTFIKNSQNSTNYFAALTMDNEYIKNMTMSINHLAILLHLSKTSDTMQK